jgi:hypothetical protein
MEYVNYPLEYICLNRPPCPSTYPSEPANTHQEKVAYVNMVTNPHQTQTPHQFLAHPNRKNMLQDIPQNISQNISQNIPNYKDIPKSTALLKQYTVLIPLTYFVCFCQNHSADTDRARACQGVLLP